MRLLFAIAILWSVLTGQVAHAAHTRVELILGANSAAPGSTVLVGVHLQMEPGWHTYWKNPGEAGEATEIKWQLPSGVTAGTIQWPLPEKIPPLDITTYGYENEVVLLVPLKLAKTVHEGPLNLSAKVSWLECKDSCIPSSTTVQAVLNVGKTTDLSASMPLLQAWQAKVPVADTNFSALAWWEKPTDNKTRALDLQWAGPTNNADFFSAAYDDFDLQGATEIVNAPEGQVHLRKVVKKYSGDWPEEISGVIVIDVGNSRQGFVVKLPVAESSASIPRAKSTPITTSAIQISRPATPLLPPLEVLLVQILAALAGGVIMNLMPCVLPILSLKIVSLVQLHGREAAEGRRHSLIYLLGVLISFWVIAGLVIAGRLASWGEQFQDARFVVIITTLMTVIALNLFGIFEFVLPGKAMGSAAELASREGNGGAFFNGVLAVVLGASCVAPLMATAVGWAITQSPLVITLIFTAIGVGLALPYVLLTFFPVLQKILPKPGAWMDKFKISLGFPMLGMAAWAFSLIMVHYGRRGVLWVGVFLVTLGFAAWVFGEFIQRGSRRKGLAWLVFLISLVGGYGYALEYRLDWRHPVIETGKASVGHQSSGGIEWLPWSAATVARAQAAGHPVLVDFTADWCLTCQVNKRTSIEIDSVRQKLKERNFVTLVGDYTLKNPDITAELNHFERAGVPLVLVYSKDTAKPPEILPALLTPGIVLDALNQAAK